MSTRQQNLEALAALPAEALQRLIALAGGGAAPAPDAPPPGYVDLGDPNPASAEVDAENDRALFGKTSKRELAITVVIDRSGSMDEETTKAGETQPYNKLDLAKTAAAFLADCCDMYCMVEYDTAATVVLHRSKYTSTEVRTKIKGMQPRGTTNMVDGLRTAYKTIPADAADTTELVILLTDGIPTNSSGFALRADEAREKLLPLGDPCKQHVRGKDITVCTATFGNNVDPVLMHNLAEPSGLYINMPDATSLGTGFASLAAAAHEYSGNGVFNEWVVERDTDCAVVDELAGYLKLVGGDETGYSIRANGPKHCAHIGALMRKLKTPYHDAGVHDMEEYELALTNPENWTKWGQAYILAMSLAMQRRVAITHFDQLPALFRQASVKALYDQYSVAYSGMPPPQATKYRAGFTAAPVASMASYNNPDDGCVVGYCLMQMADGTTKEACACRPGDVFAGGGKIKYVLKTMISEQGIGTVVTRGANGKLLCITRWHPINLEGRWTFAKYIGYAARDDGCMQLVTFELEDRFPYYTSASGHRILALNAGIENDAVATHFFWGTDKWRDGLKNEDGVYRVGQHAIERDDKGEIVGWKPNAQPRISAAGGSV